MEKNILDASLSTTDHNHHVMGATLSHFLSNPLIQLDVKDQYFHEQATSADFFCPSLQTEVQSNISLANYFGMINFHTSPGYNFVDNSVAETEFQEHIQLSPVSAWHLSPSTTVLHEDHARIDLSPTASFLTEEMRTSMPTTRLQDVTSVITSRFDRTLNGQFKYQWDYCNTDLQNQNPFGRTKGIVHPSYHISGSLKHEQFSVTSKAYDSYCCYVPCNELALSLGSCQPSTDNRNNESVQNSGISFCGTTQLSSKDSIFQYASEFQDHAHVSSLNDCISGLQMEIGQEQNCRGIKDLSPYCDGFTPFGLFRSRYVHVIQSILSEVANYIPLNDSFSTGFDGEVRMSSSSSSNEQGPTFISYEEFQPFSGESKSPDHTEQSQETTREESQILTMLHLIDFKYKQCLEELQNVICAFSGPTEYFVPQLSSRFVLHTITFFYKNLRRRIAHCIRQLGSSRCGKEQERATESSFFHKQWALQQIRRNEEQSWRPQRGLPEKSVSVLRSWMFENFLHPYPNDNEKNLLALKSGLTRSQVANWFINARVRLWKPMIEEMYSEIIKKDRTGGREANGKKTHKSIGSKRINSN